MKDGKRHFNALVNTETWEILPVENRYIKLVPMIDQISRERGIRFVSGSYTKINTTALPLLAMSDFSKDTWRVLFTLVAHMNRQQNCTDRNSHVLTAASLAKETGLGVGSVRNILYRLRREGLIWFNGKKMLVNPFAFQIGNRHLLENVRVFKGTPYYKAWVATLKNGEPDWY